MTLFYRTAVMSGPGREERSTWPGRGPLVATSLAVVLVVCLVGGGLAAQGFCQEPGAPPGLCGKAVSHADHLLAVPALLIALPHLGATGILPLHAEFSVPPHSLLSIPDGRAPPLA